MRSLVFFLLLIISSSLCFSQSNTKKITIEKSIDSLYNRSSSWELYKVIKKDRYLDLKKEILDTISIYKSEIQDQSKLIQQLNDSLVKSKEVISILSGELNQAITSKNEMKFLGLTFHKSTFQFIVWIIFIILICALSFYAYQYKNSHSVTKKAQYELSELEEDFAAFKKKTMAKEQKLRRQLQDEINKQRGV